jgi:hypothetical protein
MIKRLNGQSRLLCLSVAFLFGLPATTLVARDELDPKSSIARGLLNGRRPLHAATPSIQHSSHNRGAIQLAVGNNGTFGTQGGTIQDPFTGDQIQSCVYPKGSDIVGLWVAAMWIGAIVGRDTLVSTGNEDFYANLELWSEVAPFGDFTYKSIDVNSAIYASDAYSEQDILCEYTDTLTNPNLVSSDAVDNRPHKPLGIKGYQRSMAWSYSYADDFILFDYQVENIGLKRLKDLYIGIYVDGDMWHQSRNDPTGWNDDMVGFYRFHPAPEGCGFLDTVNIAWHADADGDPIAGAWDDRSALSVLGTRVVRTPTRNLNYAFNWWITNYGDVSQDFGPRRIGTDSDRYRYFGPRMGTPEGDRNKYYVMKHGEFDYDLLYSAKDHTQEGFLPPPEFADEIAHGWDTRYLLSVGPFDVDPGERLPISFAWIGGTNFHIGATDFATYFNPDNPDVFVRRLNFNNLAANARWASWVYDTPGYDTDGDHFFGKSRICTLDSQIVRIDTIVNGFDTTFVNIYEPTLADTTWYEGDGVPDFRGAGPPPSPRVRVIPADGQLTVRWNGFYSETTRDIFSKLIDFEGYRVHIGRDNSSPASFSTVASYDLENYNRYVYRLDEAGRLDWVLDQAPYTLDSLRVLYGNPLFDPQIYHRDNPIVVSGISYYFEQQDFNQSGLGGQGQIRKSYPTATKPTGDPNTWTADEVTTEHGSPLPKFYEYEFTISNLLSSVRYFLSVTTFDFGSPKADLPPLESDVLHGVIEEYPQFSADSVEALGKNVYIYPNPYRLDADYRGHGFEARGQSDRPDDRVREIHFANLPFVCTIRIYSLDGDLIKEIRHDKSAGDPESSHDTWDLTTRNTQAVVSGLYYWVVESSERNQIGKLVIIF